MKQWFNSTSLGIPTGQSVAATIGNAVYSGTNAVRKTAGSKNERAGEYLRLPVSSARRLHWLEVQDINALVRQHSEEKVQLMQCVNAMRKLMIQRGISVCLPLLISCLHSVLH
jgi:hypothetical protein